MQVIKKYSNTVQKALNKHTLLLAVIVSICLIGVAVGLGWYNNKVVPLSTNPIARYISEPSNPLSFMSNWDGPNYISLAVHGYQSLNQAIYFPLYPLLIRLVHMIISSPLDSALLVSWVCLVGAVYFYIKILKQIFSIKDNLMTIKGLLFFVLFPTAVFLVATYTASLVTFTALAAIYFALNRRYLLAGLFALSCAVSNTDGIFSVLLVCLILLERKVSIQKVFLTLIISSLGLAGYSYFLYRKFASPFAFILSQKSHGWLNHHYTEIFQSADFFNLVFVCLLIIAIFYWWHRRRSFSIYSFLFLLIPIVGNQFGGFNRYMLVAFPVQFMAYDYLKKKNLTYTLVIVLMSIVLAYFTLQYAGGYVGG